MSTDQITGNEQIIKDDHNTSKPYERDPRFEIRSILEEVSEVISPVWPLKDYVAVNPYFGIADKSFLAARSFLRVFSDCEMLMPMSYYAKELKEGKLSVDDIAVALAETKWPASAEPLLTADVIRLAMSEEEESSSTADSIANGAGERQIRTMAELASSHSGTNWCSIVQDEITKYCAAHFDDGQASWESPWKNCTLYQAWKAAAQIDRNVEILGIKGMRKLVAKLPQQPTAAVVALLKRSRIPQLLWSTVLLGQAFSIPGWSAWAKYQDNVEGSNADAFVSLLAMRLAYDVAISETFHVRVDWESYIDGSVAAFREQSTEVVKETWARFVLLRASEIRFRNSLLASIQKSATTHVIEREQRPLAQMAFCIDVRSERIRRQIEGRSPAIETLGFAGFFGLPIAYQSMGEVEATAQLPVLLKPKFCIEEGLHETHTTTEAQLVDLRIEQRTWRKLWRSFQTSAVGCFSFVESTGLLAGIKMVGAAFRFPTNRWCHSKDGLRGGIDWMPRPTLRNLAQQNFSQSQQTDMVERILRNMSLTKNFSRLVVLCGHGSQTENNPLGAGLDCGACGGHSGEPNARFAALLLNQPYIRTSLKERDIEIPEDTYFVAAVHNTTTDYIEFCDEHRIPGTHRNELWELKAIIRDASSDVRQDRMATLGSTSQADVWRRAKDWSEVRPEWGLAGNAAFIAGPRSLTKQCDLNAQVFLHNYDYTLDTDGSTLETIMTAPMVVANWINMQYYASTVDQRHFGSGNKTLHNVVGRFGILSGTAGDLKTGLPWQSLHNGKDYQHRPLRLQTIIAAPRSSIETIVMKHPLVWNLITNGWVHLVALDDDAFYSYGSDGQWHPIEMSL